MEVVLQNNLVYPRQPVFFLITAILIDHIAQPDGPCHKLSAGRRCIIQS